MTLHGKIDVRVRPGVATNKRPEQDHLPSAVDPRQKLDHRGNRRFDVAGTPVLIGRPLGAHEGYRSTHSSRRADSSPLVRLYPLQQGQNFDQRLTQTTSGSQLASWSIRISAAPTPLPSSPSALFRAHDWQPSAMPRSWRMPCVVAGYGDVSPADTVTSRSSPLRINAAILASDTCWESCLS